MSKQNNSKSFQITLSAVACALAVVFLSMGLFNRFMLATGYVMASVSLMLPLAKKFYVGTALAYIATCVLTVILGAIGVGWLLVPFAMFFGLHPIVNALQMRFKVNRWLALAIKAVWFDLTLWVMYILVFGSSIGNENWAFYEVINTYALALIFTAGTAFFIAYDYFTFYCQRAVNAFVKRIKK